MQHSQQIQFTFIDLFSGIGSFHYSFKQLGGECVLACDIDSDANSTYILNYGVLPYENIFDLPMEQIPYSDLLCAGFPCQAFSNIGLKKAWKDARSQVFFPVLDILKNKKIPCILFENVEGLVNLKKGQELRQILTSLKDLNYECFWKVLNCSDYGIPQNRKRLFIVGFHDSILQKKSPRPHQFEFPPKTNLKYSLSEILNKNFNQKIARTIRVGGRNSPLNDRHNWDGYTLFPSQTEYRLSIQDCILLQNFKTSFQLCGCQTSQYKQLGNTIPTNLSFVLGEQIIKYLDNIKYFQTKRKKFRKSNPQIQYRAYLRSNHGEFGEYMIKAQLLCFQNQYIRTPFGDIKRLENAPNQLIQNKKLTLFKLYQLSDSELVHCFTKSNILKSKSLSKADVFINDRGVSIKTQNNPAIINHTHRQNFLRVLEYLNLNIQTLDLCISEYHRLRQNNHIGEDIFNSNPLSPFKKYKSYFTPILKYFLFYGSGRSISNHSAESLLFVKSQSKGSIGQILRYSPHNWYWFSNSQQFIDKIWDYLIFSLRDKGLNYEKKNCDSQKILEPWVQQYKSGKTQILKKKGCLHVRLHSSFTMDLENYKFLDQCF
uniref:Cytosine-specific methyltransferase n=1 Tax=Caulerpa serrulata TaxID=177068 RepID=A0A6B9UEM8_9CHLO|nr:putative DNA methyltransferase [Caulerpa serrulata]